MKFYSTIRSLHEAYEKQEVTPFDYISWLLQCAEESNSEKGLFTTLLKERALSEAKASTERWLKNRPLGLFDGVPIVWKDLFDIKDVVTTGSSLAYATAAASKDDAAVVAYYSEQGGINLGKVGLSEFAYSALGINPYLGTPRNAASTLTDRVPGGSSSGTAVAVKRNLVSFGMGTDTSGSIRIPAALHGLYGYKPSKDFYEDRSGIMPLSETLDTFGPIAQSLQDCFDFYCLMNHVPYKDLKQRESETHIFEEYRYVIPINVVTDNIDADVLNQFEKAIQLIEKSGIVVHREVVSEIDDVHRIMNQYGTFAAAESSYYHKQQLTSDQWDLIHSRVLDRMARADSMSAVDYLSLHHLREKYLVKMQERYKNTLFLMPTVPMEAPLIAPLELDDDLFHKTNLRAMSLTVAANFLAWDSITLPMGVGDEGMPIGLMLSSVDQDVLRLFTMSSKIDDMIISSGQFT